jgi:hypothetical protein
LLNTDSANLAEKFHRVMFLQRCDALSFISKFNHLNRSTEGLPIQGAFRTTDFPQGADWSIRVSASQSPVPHCGRSWSFTRISQHRRRPHRRDDTQTLGSAVPTRISDTIVAVLRKTRSCDVFAAPQGREKRSKTQ